ncbi:MAG: hypothetical protein GXO64_00850 [Candidatus Micrarchaeota archaeon]|nr:hypothetical protein [Candidatus Micrarchaeota archaeon]
MKMEKRDGNGGRFAHDIGMIALQVFAIFITYLFLAWPVAHAAQFTFIGTGGTQAQADIKMFSDVINKDVLLERKHNNQFVKIKLSAKPGYDLQKVYLFRCRDLSPSECINAGRPPSVSVFDVPATFEEESIWYDIAQDNTANIMIFAKVGNGANAFWTGSWTNIKFTFPINYEINSFDAPNAVVYLKDQISPDDAKHYAETSNYVPGTWTEKVSYSTVGGSAVTAVETVGGNLIDIDRQGTMIPSFQASQITGSDLAAISEELLFSFPKGEKTGSPLSIFLNTQSPTPQCSEGQITSACTCGGVTYSTGYCCSGAHQNSECANMPPAPTCQEGQITSACTCGGTEYSTGYCCSGTYQTTVCPQPPSACPDGQITSECMCGPTLYSTGYCCSGTYQTTPCNQVQCGNNVKETGEECDGTDDSACPGRCKSDCTCERLPPVLRFDGVSLNPYQCGLPNTPGVIARFSVDNDPGNPSVTYSINNGEFKSVSCSGSYSCTIPDDEICSLRQETLQMTFKFTYGSTELTKSFTLHASFPPPSMSIDSITPNVIQTNEKRTLSVYLHVRNADMIEYDENNDFEFKYADKSYEKMSCTLDRESASKKYYDCDVDVEMPDGYEGYHVIDFKLRYTLNGVKTLTSSYYPLIVRENPQPVCRNNVKETGEECDGTDDSACPGRCKSDCTCADEPPPSNCPDGEITASCKCNGIVFNPGSGYCCSNAFQLVACNQQVPDCQDGMITSTCSCGGTEYSTGYCCSGTYQESVCEPPEPVLTIRMASSANLDCNNAKNTQAVVLTASVRNKPEGTPQASYSIDDGASYSTVTCQKISENEAAASAKYSCPIPVDDICSLGSEHFNIMLKMTFGSVEVVSDPQPMFVTLPEPNLQVLYVTGQPFMLGEKSAGSVRLFITNPSSPLAPANPQFEYSYDRKSPQQLSCQKTSTTDDRAYYSCENVEFDISKDADTFNGEGGKKLLSVVFSVKDSSMVKVMNVEVNEMQEKDKPRVENIVTEPSAIKGYPGDSIQVQMTGTLVENSYDLDFASPLSARAKASNIADITGISCSVVQEYEKSAEISCSFTLKIKNNAERAAGAQAKFELTAKDKEGNAVATDVALEFDVLERAAELKGVSISPQDIYCEGTGQNNPSQIEFTATIDGISGDLSLVSEEIRVGGRDGTNIKEISVLDRVCSVESTRIKCTIPVNVVLSEEGINCRSLEVDSITKHELYVRVGIRNTEGERINPSGSADISVHAPPLRPVIEILEGPDGNMNMNCLKDNSITIGRLKIDYADILHQEPDSPLQWSYSFNAYDSKGKITTGGEQAGDEYVVCNPAKSPASGQSFGYDAQHRYEFYTCTLFVKQSLFTKCPMSPATGTIMLKVKGTKEASIKIPAVVGSGKGEYKLVAVKEASPPMPTRCQLMQEDGTCYVMGSVTNFTVTIKDSRNKVSDAYPLPPDLQFSTATAALLDNQNGRDTQISINCQQVSLQMPPGSVEYERTYQCNLILPQTIHTEKLTGAETESNIEEVGEYRLGKLKVYMTFTYASGKGIANLEVGGLPSATLKRIKSVQLISYEKQLEDTKKMTERYMNIIRKMIFLAAFCAVCSASSSIYEKSANLFKFDVNDIDNAGSKNKNGKSAGMDDGSYDPKKFTSSAIFAGTGVLGSMPYHYKPYTRPVSFGGECPDGKVKVECREGFGAKCKSDNDYACVDADSNTDNMVAFDGTAYETGKMIDTADDSNDLEKAVLVNGNVVWHDADNSRIDEMKQFCSSLGGKILNAVIYCEKANRWGGLMKDDCDDADDGYYCCGDDPKEFYIKSSIEISGTTSYEEACCDKKTDCVYDNKCYDVNDFTDYIGGFKYKCIDGNKWSKMTSTTPRNDKEQCESAWKQKGCWE